MESQLIGYFPKRKFLRPEPIKAAQVREICSVSNCMSQPPENWINHWKHNEMWYYDSPEVAWSIVPESENAEFILYAYRLFSRRFQNGKQEAFEIPKIKPVPLSEDFKPIGWDVVSRSLGTTFECSPLSCNYLADEIEVNEFCLLNSAKAALKVAEGFSLSQPEPGPYFVVEVFRKM